MCKATYIHVPFCRSICAYCDFFRCGYNPMLANRWLQVIIDEIKCRLQKDLKTIYIGGGTPSALQEEQLERLLQALYPYSSQCEEYTIESNIESLSDKKLTLMNRYGVNRISLGVQTLQPSLLKTIRRSHQASDVYTCINRIHQHGIHNISIDLIYGLPGQTLAMWQQDLKTIVDTFDIQHISLYALTIEPNSEFGRKGVQNIDDEVEADMYEYAIRFLEANGFHQYEISNFAKEDKASKHNQYYWRYDDFYGIGCGASGKEHHQRYDNTKNLQEYIEKGASPTYIPLTKQDEMFEMIMMSLRMKKGLDLNHFEDIFGVSIFSIYQAIIDQKVQQGLLCIENNHLFASEHGYPILHEILLDFLPE